MGQSQIIRRLILTTAAQYDLVAIGNWIGEQSGSRTVAEVIVERLIRRCEKLSELPGTLGTARPELRPDIRSTQHEGYVIFFRYGLDSLEIVNILHGARDAYTYYDN